MGPFVSPLLLIFSRTGEASTKRDERFLSAVLSDYLEKTSLLLHVGLLPEGEAVELGQGHPEHQLEVLRGEVPLEREHTHTSIQTHTHAHTHTHTHTVATRSQPTSPGRSLPPDGAIEGIGAGAN